MNEFCDRYRERSVANPRQMLALRNTKVDLSKWEPMSFSATPPSKMKDLAAKRSVILEAASKVVRRRVV